VRAGVTSFVSGLVFALGLVISGMTQPSKVIGFLDFGGAWDPSLAFVMVGAIGAHFFFARRASAMKAPLFAERFALTDRTTIDAPLVIGAALFGVGWGLGGYCPGPAIVSVASLAPATLLFVFAMGLGMLVTRRFVRNAE
jgi:uncharacterized membrane protein YedE/YeeE